MTHAELCKKTACRFGRKALVTLVEYQSYVTEEFPDVLVFDGATTLFEIKVSRSDFLADSKKDCRTKYSPKVSSHLSRRALKGYGDVFLQIQSERPELFYIEYPHMGLHRYYVCEAGLIAPEEVRIGWGLYWVKGGRFYLKKESGKFRRNVNEEIKIIAHAFRKYAIEKTEKVIFGEYKFSHIQGGEG